MTYSKPFLELRERFTKDMWHGFENNLLELPYSINSKLLITLLLDLKDSELIAATQKNLYSKTGHYTRFGI